MIEAEISRRSDFESKFSPRSQISDGVFGQQQLLSFNRSLGGYYDRLNGFTMMDCAPQFSNDAEKEEHEEKNMVLLKSKITSDLNYLTNRIEQLRNRKQIVHVNLVPMLDFVIRKRQDFCSTFYEIKIFYQHYTTNLREQIDLRREDEHFFLEKEMVGFLYDILDVMATLQQNKIRHGDIRPELLYFDEVEGKTITKVCDRLSDQDTGVEAQMNYLASKTNIYMSPTLFSHLVRGRFDFQHNSYKSDMFSLGLIFLEMGTLESVQHVYDVESGEVDNRVLEDLFARFEERYSDSPLLCSAVKNMIQIDPKNRSDAKRLYKRLPSMDEIREYYEAVENIESEVKHIQNNDYQSLPMQLIATPQKYSPEPHEHTQDSHRVEQRHTFHPSDRQAQLQDQERQPVSFLESFTHHKSPIRGHAQHQDTDSSHQLNQDTQRTKQGYEIQNFAVQEAQSQRSPAFSTNYVEYASEQSPLQRHDTRYDSGRYHTQTDSQGKAENYHQSYQSPVEIIQEQYQQQGQQNLQTPLKSPHREASQRNDGIFHAQNTTDFVRVQGASPSIIRSSQVKVIRASDNLSPSNDYFQKNMRSHFDQSPNRVPQNFATFNGLKSSGHEIRKSGEIRHVIQSPHRKTSSHNFESTGKSNHLAQKSPQFQAQHVQIESPTSGFQENLNPFMFYDPQVELKKNPQFQSPNRIQAYPLGLQPTTTSRSQTNISNNFANIGIPTQSVPRKISHNIQEIAPSTPKRISSKSPQHYHEFQKSPGFGYVEKTPGKIDETIGKRIVYLEQTQFPSTPTRITGHPQLLYRNADSSGKRHSPQRVYQKQTVEGLPAKGLEMQRENRLPASTRNQTYQDISRSQTPQRHPNEAQTVQFDNQSEQLHLGNEYQRGLSASRSKKSVEKDLRFLAENKSIKTQSIHNDEISTKKSSSKPSARIQAGNNQVQDHDPNIPEVKRRIVRRILRRLDGTEEVIEDDSQLAKIVNQNQQNLQREFQISKSVNRSPIPKTSSQADSSPMRGIQVKQNDIRRSGTENVTPSFHQAGSSQFHQKRSDSQKLLVDRQEPPKLNEERMIREVKNKYPADSYVYIPTASPVPNYYQQDTSQRFDIRYQQLQNMHENLSDLPRTYLQQLLPAKPPKSQNSRDQLDLDNSEKRIKINGQETQEFKRVAEPFKKEHQNLNSLQNKENIRHQPPKPSQVRTAVENTPNQYHEGKYRNLSRDILSPLSQENQPTYKRAHHHPKYQPSIQQESLTVPIGSNLLTSSVGNDDFNTYYQPYNPNDETSYEFDTGYEQKTI